MIGVFECMLNPLKLRIQGMVVKGVVTAITESLPTRKLQATMLDGLPVDNIDHFEPFGLTCCPVPGAKGIFLAVNGNRSHPVAVVVADPRYRPVTLQPGEVALYDANGNVVKLGKTELQVSGLLKAIVSAPEVDVAATTKVAISAPEIDLIGAAINLSGAVAIEGSATLNGTAMS